MIKQFRVVTISLFLLMSMSSVLYAQGNTYTTRNIEQINGIDYWTGFKQSHFGYIPPSTAWKGQKIDFSFPYKYIDIDGKVKDGISKGSNTSIGYGGFVLDYQLHMIGYLSYIKNNIKSQNYPSPYLFENGKIYDYDAMEYVPNYINYNMDKACEEMINKIIIYGNNEKFIKNQFDNFWKQSITADREAMFKKMENEFYLKAYGTNAIEYLSSEFGITPESKDTYAPAIRGAIWSIMEERYRRKKLGDKANLELKVAAGEVLPFLLYIDCDYVDLADGNRDYSNIMFELKKVDESGNTKYDNINTIDIDQVIDGAYQYMVYYYAKEGIYNRGYKTALGSIDNELDYDYDSMSDFMEEYVELTGRPFPVLKGKDLDEFLNRIEEKKVIFKKSKENTYGTFGEDEEYTIESDKNFSKAISDMGDAMYKFCQDENGNVDKKIWAGLSKENVARTYLMAKNIIESDRVRYEYSYYDIGTNIIDRTCGYDNNIYLLTDFQKVELVEPLSRPGEGWTDMDTDDDGVLDRNELTGYRDIDITGFIRKTLYADLYGVEPTNIDANEKWTRKQKIDDLMAQYKKNVKEEFDKSRCNNQYDSGLYYDQNKDQLTVSLWDYVSNPVLSDTDFDGIGDKEDKRPLSNHFKGKMHSTRLSGDNGIEVDMTMDYRYFLMDNRNYYDELSTMSLLYANSIYQKADNQPEHSGIEILDDNNAEVNKNLQVKKMMEFFGFKDVKTYYLGEEGSENSDGSDYCRNYKDTHKSKVAIGYKNIEYHGIEKTVVGIVIRGTAEDDDWDSDFDMGDLELRDAILEETNPGHENYVRNLLNQIPNHIKVDEVLDGFNKYDQQYNTELSHFAYGYPDWTHKYHHAGFDIVANRIMEILEEYMDENHDMNVNICYWITGHSMGAGVANIVGAELLHGYSGINNRTDNVYCYTFASPNTFYLTDNTNIRQNIAIPNAEVIETYREPHGIKYRCIFNIVNDDDFVPKLPMEECEWTRYGRTAKMSVKEFIYQKDSLKLSTYNYKLRHEFDEYLMPIYNIERFIYNKYPSSSNKQKIEGIIKEFNRLYKNDNNYVSNMRTITYLYDINDTINKKNATDYTIANNAKPYQKLINITDLYYQIQNPAYFMQSISHSMHEHKDKSDENNSSNSDDKADPDLVFGNSNKKQFFFLPLAKKYIIAKDKLIAARDVIEAPHMLEPYYYMTKVIDPLNFN